MNEIHCTVVGNAVTEVRMATTRTGHRVASFRLAATTRRYNRETARWEDLDTSYVTVTAWRSLHGRVERGTLTWPQFWDRPQDHPEGVALMQAVIAGIGVLSASVAVAAPALASRSSRNGVVSSTSTLVAI